MSDIDAWESKGATSLTVALIADALYGARVEIERLNVVVDQEARARQHAESEVARLQSYIAAGVGGAS